MRDKWGVTAGTTRSGSNARGGRAGRGGIAKRGLSKGNIYVCEAGRGRRQRRAHCYPETCMHAVLMSHVSIFFCSLVYAVCRCCTVMCA